MSIMTGMTVGYVQCILCLTRAIGYRYIKKYLITIILLHFLVYLIVCIQTFNPPLETINGYLNIDDELVYYKCLFIILMFSEFVYIKAFILLRLYA